MDMKTVKNITIPEGNVKKIENSNGDILWASYDEFPYRQLEYVETDGAGIDTGIQASTSLTSYPFYTRFMPYEAEPNGQYRVISNYTSTATLKRKYPVVIHGANHCIRNVIGNSWEGSTSAYANTLYTVESSLIYNTRYIEVNGVRETLTSASSDSGSSGNTYGYGLTVEGGSLVGTSKFIGRLYGFRYGYESGVGTGQWFIPCQRKSDGKVGFARFHKVWSGSTWSFDSFIPSGSSKGIEFVAGPVTNEYMDINSTSSPAPF